MCSNSYLYVGALRFFRTCIHLNDDFYHRYLIKHNVMQHIMDMLLATGNKNNLVNSACIEFFDFIRSVSCHMFGLLADHG